MITSRPKYYGNILAFDDKILSITVDHFMHLKTYVLSLQPTTKTTNNDPRRIFKCIKKIWIESSNITPLDEIMEVSTETGFYATIKDNSYLIFVARCDEVDTMYGIASLLGLMAQNVFTIKAEDSEGNVYKFRTLFNISEPSQVIYAINSLEFDLIDL